MRLRKLHKIFLGIVLCITGFLPAYAAAPYISSDSGNAAYAKGNYAKAISFYNIFLNSGYVSAAVLYNMGNCYYKTNDIPKAILYYEKARKIAPQDADIQFNLQLANQKTVDKISGDNQLFFIGWWDNLINMASEKGWALLCILFLSVFLSLIIVYLLSPRMVLKQLGFWGGVLMLILSIFSFVLSREQYIAATTHDTAIVMTATVTVKGAPADNSTRLFVIHEGDKVKVLKTEGNWVEVKLFNGNQGWMEATDIAFI